MAAQLEVPGAAPRGAGRDQLPTGISSQLATITPKLSARQLAVLIAAYKAALSDLAAAAG